MARCVKLSSSLLILLGLSVLEMGGASPVPVHNQRDFLKTMIQLVNSQNHHHQSNSVHYQQQRHWPPMAKPQNHQPSHHLPRPDHPLASTNTKKTSLTEELEGMLNALPQQWRTRPRKVDDWDKSRSRTRPTTPRTKTSHTKTSKTKSKEDKCDKHVPSPEVVTTEFPTRSVTEKSLTTTEIEEMVPTTPMTTGIEGGTETNAAVTPTTTETTAAVTPTTTETATVTPTTTETAAVTPTTTEIPLDAVELAWMKMVLSQQNQPQESVAETPRKRRFFFYPTASGEVCIFAETGYENYDLVVRPCHQYSEYEKEGCSPVPGYYDAEVCDTIYPKIVCYKYTGARNICL